MDLIYPSVHQYGSKKPLTPESTGNHQSEIMFRKLVRTLLGPQTLGRPAKVWRIFAVLCMTLLLVWVMQIVFLTDRYGRTNVQVDAHAISNLNINGIVRNLEISGTIVNMSEKGDPKGMDETRKEMELDYPHDYEPVEEVSIYGAGGDRVEGEPIMDMLNPFRDKVHANNPYSFHDYFDYEDVRDYQTMYGSEKNHTLGIIVPFRKAWVELKQFLPYMHHFLKEQRIRHVFYIVNQVDNLRFNRASLINVGFLQMIAHGVCDYFVMHDVDLLPLNRALRYHYPSRGPLHLASPKLHPKYSKPDFVGAILIMSNQQYYKINGMSNIFWGWGREDEEFRMRLRKGNLKIYRPTGVSTDNTTTFLHIHDILVKRRRDKNIYGDQLKARFQADTQTGLNTTRYRVISRKVQVVNNITCVLIDVSLSCNMTLSPWCVTPRQLSQYNLLHHRKRNRYPGFAELVGTPPKMPQQPTRKSTFSDYMREFSKMLPGISLW